MHLSIVRSFSKQTLQHSVCVINDADTLFVTCWDPLPGLFSRPVEGKFSCMRTPFLRYVIWRWDFELNCGKRHNECQDYSRSVTMPLKMTAFSHLNAWGCHRTAQFVVVALEASLHNTFAYCRKHSGIVLPWRYSWVIIWKSCHGIVAPFL